MNHPELEERLRSAYRARAELVDQESLTSSAATFDAPVPVVHASRRPFVAPLLAAAAVLLLAIAAAVITHVVDRKTSPAEQQLRFTTRPVTSWDGVAPGWSIALWSPTTASHDYTVYLVSPTGERQNITALHGARLSFAGISQDNSHVAFISQQRGGGFTVIVVDLRAHATHRFTVAAGEFWVGFASADGASSRVMASGDRTKIVDDTGAVRSIRPPSAADHALNTATGSSMALSINGRIAIVTTSRQIVVKTLRGSVLTTLPMPPGGGCLATRPWNASSLLVQCDSGIWAVPLNGGRATLLAAPTPGVKVGQGVDSAPYRLYDVMPVAGELYGVEVPSCGGNDVIARIGADKKPQRVTEHGLPVTGGVTGHTDEAFYYVAFSGCQLDGGTLYRYAPAQHTVTALLGGAGPGGGVVRSAWTIEAPAPGGHRLAF